MSSPLVRAWLAARLPDWADHAYACWRGTLHTLGISTEWDPCEIDPLYTDLPGPERPDRSNDAHGAPQGSTETSPCKSGRGAGEPAFHLMRICPVCQAHVGAPCTTADNKVTGPHKRRREAS